MSSNPINLAVRFILELAMLAALGRWGWEKHEGWLKYLLVITLPVFAATLWGVFRIPNDPKKAPVPVKGIVRLILELGLFAVSVLALYNISDFCWSYIMAFTVIVHYLVSYDRIVWMVKQ